MRWTGRGVVGINHALDFGGLDDGIEGRGQIGDLDHFGDKRWSGRSMGFEEGAIDALEEFAKGSRAVREG